MSMLWAEEQKALLPLPREPFEAVEFKNVRVNKYGKVKIDTESYELPRAKVGESILAKIWWNKIELLDQNQQCLATYPRPYTLKPKPIDWQGHFAIFNRKPNGAKNSSLYRFLPPAVLSYLEADPERYRDRLKFVYTLLKETYTIDFIAQCLSKVSETQIDDQALIWHLIYQLSSQECPPKAIDEHMSPLSVQEYLPQIEAYNQLMPQPKGGGENAAILVATV